VTSRTAGAKYRLETMRLRHDGALMGECKGSEITIGKGGDLP
jgi:hypothetical protein